MEAEDIGHKNVLNLQCVNFNQWSQNDYDNIKKSKNMNRSLRGSQIVMDVIANLKVRGFYSETGNYNYHDDHEANYNRVYQRSYGFSFKQFLENNKVRSDDSAKPTPAVGHETLGKPQGAVRSEGADGGLDD